MTSTDRETLIRAHLDGSASDEQVRELDRLLAADASARQALLNESAFESQIRVVLHREGTAHDAGGGRRPLRPRFVLKALAAAAGLALAVGVAWYAVTSRPATSSASVRVAVASSPAVSPPVAPVAPPVVPLATAPELPPVEALGVVSHVQGMVTLVSSRQPEGVTARDQRSIAAGDILTVGSNAEARVRYTDGSQLIVYARTRLSFEPSAGGKLVQLDQGAVDADIMPQPTNRTMVLYTARLTAEVIGTQFRLIDDGRSSWLAVKTGHVRVTANTRGSPVEVTGNRYAKIGEGRNWGPFPAKTCPYWKAASSKAVGDRYP